MTPLLRRAVIDDGGSIFYSMIARVRSGVELTFSRSFERHPLLVRTCRHNPPAGTGSIARGEQVAVTGNSGGKDLFCSDVESILTMR